MNYQATNEELVTMYRNGADEKVILENGIGKLRNPIK